jgi:carboxymethylenebutenolidase
MIETKFEIPTIRTEAFLYRPDDIGEFPGVVLLTDVWGIRPANIGMAKRLAEKGFAVLLPNVFHRYSRVTPDGFDSDDPEEQQKRLGQLFQALTPAQMDSDGKAYVDFLLAQKGVKQGWRGGLLLHRPDGLAHRRRRSRQGGRRGLLPWRVAGHRKSR